MTVYGTHSARGNRERFPDTFAETLTHLMLQLRGIISNHLELVLFVLFELTRKQLEYCVILTPFSSLSGQRGYEENKNECGSLLQRAKNERVRHSPTLYSSFLYHRTR